MLWHFQSIEGATKAIVSWSNIKQITTILFEPKPVTFQDHLMTCLHNLINNQNLNSSEMKLMYTVVGLKQTWFPTKWKYYILVYNLRWSKLPSRNLPLPPSLSWNGCWIGPLKVLMHTMSLLQLSLYGAITTKQFKPSSWNSRKHELAHHFFYRKHNLERKVFVIITGETLVHVKYCSDVSYWFFPGASSSFVCFCCFW